MLSLPYYDAQTQRLLYTETIFLTKYIMAAKPHLLPHVPVPSLIANLDTKQYIDITILSLQLIDVL